MINRIAQSPIITFKIEELYDEGERVQIDIADQLYMGVMLREKDFRAWIKSHDWSQYTGKHVAVHCSVDAIIQTWAWMLMVAPLQAYAQSICFGNLDDLENYIWKNVLDTVDYSQFQDRPVVIKGCSKLNISAGIYTELTRRIMPYAKKLSFGEPCSTVPVYKRAK